jgi:putative Ca2+/H+ antiporter (TMEM165/GDT1 family)
LTTFLTAFAATLLAEMGDKTQLVTLTLSTRHPPLQVLAGALGALAAITGLAVVLGDYLAVFLPAQLALLAGGIFFLVIGIFMLLKKEEKEDSKPADSNSAIALQTFIMVFLAELGDKTQLTAIALTAATGKPAAVFLGAMGGQLVNHSLAAFLGSRCLARLPAKFIRLAGALLFLLFCVLFLIEALI